MWVVRSQRLFSVVARSTPKPAEKEDDLGLNRAQRRREPVETWRSALPLAGRRSSSCDTTHAGHEARQQLLGRFARPVVATVLGKLIADPPSGEVAWVSWLP